MPNQEGLMKISELAAAAGVSKQTIHYYLREGLLSPPVQSSRNMAYYDSRHIEQIHLIKELQGKRYYPLSVIKFLIQNGHTGGNMESSDHMEAMDMLFNQARGDIAEGYRTLNEIADESGLPAPIIKELESMGLITVSVTEAGNRFTGYDVAIAKAIKQILELGLESDDLKIFAQLLTLFRTEAEIVHNKVIHGKEHPPLKDINTLVGNVRLLLMAKAYREYFIEHRHLEEEGGDENA
ncbi:MAG TPA: MerR family transcriptional regulator [Syntrophomonadaceae bacterium]|nr:MerR family transcriptional regulator [Syntrophomonadaceae bacterium]